MSKQRKLKIGVIGLGGMGLRTAKALHESSDWDLVSVADLIVEKTRQVKELYPYIQTYQDGMNLINDPGLDAVAIATLADIRPKLMKAALRRKKHILAEKPIAETIASEEDLLQVIERSGFHVAVNLFNRNAWYHEEMLQFTQSGEIGDLVSIRVRHQTPGLLPEAGHGPEGAPFHDCGMHYVDVARWYSQSEFKEWHAQGICLWGHYEPWHVDVHGSFENGIVFNITQGFIFGHEAQTSRVSCGLELIGSGGVIVMEHDFITVKIDMRGRTKTIKQEGPYGGKKMNVMAARLAQAINGGEVKYPLARDSVTASRLSWDMLHQASQNAPRHGNRGDLERVKALKS